MGRKTDQVRIRCDPDTFEEWVKVANEIDPRADYEDILETMMQAYHEEPDLFHRIHEFGPALGGY